MSGTSPTLAGPTGTSTGCPGLFAHSARPGRTGPGRDRGREVEPPGHALDDARGPLTRGLVRLLPSRSGQLRFQTRIPIEVPSLLSTLMLVPVLGTFTLAAGWVASQYDSLSWNSAWAAWPRM